ncbi:restriction endonuclease subunit S [Tissierella sp. MB52-C2]|uniref:restriction endonuclease subunit S n=1 Tax=Tissierella sp. MB52-C2 TaxID=3070999 RepID=UPI00280BCA0C|nr:restriction endonuclease subunit S [Tissierella sp. MB52-C2]WMM26030.1 restriction endonuclease subunit S [Tissierella sp. MB52-C2]
MMKPNFMEKLLDGVEVEWKALGEVSNVLRGRRLTRNQLSDAEKFPVFHGGLEPLGYYGQSNRPAHSVMVINVGASAGIVGYSAVDFWSSDGCFCIQHSDLLNNKFIYYFLIGQQHLLRSKVRVAGIPTLDAIVVEKLQIPIPPLKVQEEIVRILDAFTKLTAELTAELTARKKQYEYYRDKLLTFEEGEVEWKALGGLAENLDSMRKPVTSGVREFGDIPYYGASGIVDYVKDYIFEGDFLLISEDGANLLARNTPIAFSASGRIWVNNHAHVLKFKTYEERRFVEFYLNYIDLTPYISGAAQPKLNQKNLNSIMVPNPLPLQKKRIVSILDKFDALTSSITEGLPCEIELRQKQYEYYRNMLLSFPKKEVED